MLSNPAAMGHEASLGPKAKTSFRLPNIKQQRGLRTMTYHHHPSKKRSGILPPAMSRFAKRAKNRSRLKKEPRFHTAMAPCRRRLMRRPPGSPREPCRTSFHITIFNWQTADFAKTCARQNLQSWLVEPELRRQSSRFVAVLFKDSPAGVPV